MQKDITFFQQNWWGVMPRERISCSLVLMNDKRLRHKADVPQLPLLLAVFLNAVVPCLALRDIKQPAENEWCFIENVNHLSQGLGKGTILLRGGTEEFSEWSRAESASPPRSNPALSFLFFV